MPTNLPQLTPLAAPRPAPLPPLRGDPRAIDAGSVRNAITPPDRADIRVSVIVPALNEADNLPHVFARLPGGLHEVLLVDGHSTDDTIAVARRLRPDIQVVRQSGHGKGDALTSGFAAATGDILVMIDADGSTDPAEMPRFVAALLDGADFAKGSRFMDGGGSADITVLRKLGNRVLNLAVNTLFGTRYTDLCYGYNAFWRDCLPHMNAASTGFEVETLINVRIAKAGLRVTEVASFEAERLHGESKLHVVRDGWRVLTTIVRERFNGSALAPAGRRPALRQEPASC